MFVSQPDTDDSAEGGDLDFSSINVVPTKADDAADKQRAEARARAEMAAELAIKQKAEAAAERARIENEAAVAARAKAAALADTEAKAKARQEASLREQAEAKAKMEAAARLQAQHEAARAKAAQEVAARAKAEAEARVRAEIEAAALKQKEIEAKAKQEAEARLKIEQEAARVKAELEATARAKAEAAVRAKIEAEKRTRAEIEAAALKQKEIEAKAKQEAEARLKVEQEAARVKAELEATARAKAEAEAALLKAEQEAARVKAELEAARVRAEQEAARVKAELEAAKARAEAEAKALAEARIKQEMEERARQEAEAKRLKAEQEAARVKAERDAAARVAAEAHAKRLEAEEAAKREVLKREAEERTIRAAALAKQDAIARAEKENYVFLPTPAFEIKLDDFKKLTESLDPAIASEAHRAEPASDQVAPNPEAGQPADVAVTAKAESEKISLQNIAAEMARLKEQAEEEKRKAEEMERRLAEEQAQAAEQAAAWAEAEQRAKAQALLELEQAAKRAEQLQAKATQAPVAKPYRAPLPYGKIALGLIVLAVVAVIALPYFYPLNEYVAPIEQRLSAQLKQPVHIDGMTASSLPPKLQLQNVTMGSGQEVKIGSVVLNLDLLSLFSEVKVISNATLQDISIDGATLGKQAESLKLLGGDAQYVLRHLTVQRLKVVTDEVVLPTFSGIGEIDAQGMINRVSLHGADDKLAIDLQNNQGRWQLSANIKDSSLPLFPEVVFGDLSAQGDIGDGEVNFTEMDAHIYNGILLGSAKLNWRKGWQLQGHYEAKMFDLARCSRKPSKAKCQPRDRSRWRAQSFRNWMMSLISTDPSLRKTELSAVLMWSKPHAC